MRHIVEEMDLEDRYGYVLASPAGVGLYSKFGFEVAGQVETPHGFITSMLRQPNPTLSRSANEDRVADASNDLGVI